MRASRRLLWKLSVIVLLAVYSQPSFSEEENCPANAGSSETGNRREAAELKQPEQGNLPEMNWPGKWELFLKNSGVSAMHAILMPKINQVQFYDATIWRISKIKLPPGVPCHVYDTKTGATDCWAHSVLVDIETGNIRPLAVIKTTHCYCSAKHYEYLKYGL